MPTSQAAATEQHAVSVSTWWCFCVRYLVSISSWAISVSLRLLNTAPCSLTASAGYTRKLVNVASSQLVCWYGVTADHGILNDHLSKLQGQINNQEFQKNVSVYSSLLTKRQKYGPIVQQLKTETKKTEITGRKTDPKGKPMRNMRFKVRPVDKWGKDRWAEGRRED